MNKSPMWFEYSMAVHVHSRYSDGSGTVPAILHDAQANHVDILMLTDHDTRQGAEDPGEGYFGRTLLLVGAEITPPQNHLLVMFVDHLAHPEEPWADIVDRISSQGGLSFVAHPNDRGNSTLRLPSYRWSEREVRGFTGVEIWNHLSHWSDGVKGIASGLQNLWNPVRGLDHPRPEDLQLWDQLAQESLSKGQSGVVGIGGVDAHAALIGWRRLSFKVFPYRVSFRTIRTQVYLTEPLTRDLVHDQELIKDALRSGRCAVMAYHVGSEKGFRLWAETPEKSWAMGERVTWSEQLRLKARSPVPAIWRLLRNGNLVSTTRGHLLDQALDGPGVYRVELLRGPRQRGWLYPNPIYVIGA